MTKLNLPFWIILCYALFGFATTHFGQKDVLVVLAHPNIKQSEVNKSIKSKLEMLDRVTVHDLYKQYENYNIDIGKEQELLLHHDYIILQFPMYWFSSPSLLKKWQDEVFSSAFAFDEKGLLKNKKLMIVVSTGGTEEDFSHGGLMNVTIEEVLTPFKTFALLTKMEYLEPFVTYGVPNPKILNITMTDFQLEERKLSIEEQGIKLVELIKFLE